jgi:hypothetical protein
MAGTQAADTPIQALTWDGVADGVAGDHPAAHLDRLGSAVGLLLVVLAVALVVVDLLVDLPVVRVADLLAVLAVALVVDLLVDLPVVRVADLLAVLAVALVVVDRRADLPVVRVADLLADLAVALVVVHRRADLAVVLVVDLLGLDEPRLIYGPATEGLHLAARHPGLKTVAQTIVATKAMPRAEQKGHRSNRRNSGDDRMVYLVRLVQRRGRS